MIFITFLELISAIFQVSIHINQSHWVYSYSAVQCRYNNENYILKDIERTRKDAQEYYQRLLEAEEREKKVVEHLKTGDYLFSWLGSCLLI